MTRPGPIILAIMALIATASVIYALPWGCERERVSIGGVFALGDRCK